MADADCNSTACVTAITNAACEGDNINQDDCTKAKKYSAKTTSYENYVNGFGDILILWIRDVTRLCRDVSRHVSENYIYLWGSNVTVSRHVSI